MIIDQPENGLTAPNDTSRYMLILLAC